MKNFLKNKRAIIFPLTIIMLFSLVVIAFAATPGSSEDPLISVSYLENKISELKEELSESLEKTLTENFTKKFEELATETNKTLNNLKKTGTAAPVTFEVVNILANETLICGAGTEIIVRSGECTAIASPSGGLSDVTEGRDIGNGEKITNNHLLIVPRDDGRGITATLGGAVMVKGSYEKKTIE